MPVLTLAAASALNTPTQAKIAILSSIICQKFTKYATLSFFSNNLKNHSQIVSH